MAAVLFVEFTLLITHRRASHHKTNRPHLTPSARMHLKLGPVTHEHMGLWSLRFQATVVRFPPQHFHNVQFNVGKVFVEIHRLTVHLRTELLHLNDLHLICVESLRERCFR